MTRVMAFQPRRYDPPQFVAEDRDDLALMVGEFVGAGQCDGCGCSTYQLRTAVTLPSVRIVAVCAVDPDDEFQHPAPCGQGYPILEHDEDDVVF